MVDGTCPACGANSVFKQLNGIIGDSKYVYVRGLGFSSPRVDQITLLCTQCGYYQQHIADRKALDKVEAKWEKVG